MFAEKPKIYRVFYNLCVCACGSSPHIIIISLKFVCDDNNLFNKKKCFLNKNKMVDISHYYGILLRCGFFENQKN